jgi:hypothetical protein
MLMPSVLWLLGQAQRYHLHLPEVEVQGTTAVAQIHEHVEIRRRSGAG